MQYILENRIHVPKHQPEYHHQHFQMQRNHLNPSHVHLHISNDQRWPSLSVEIVHGRICHHFNSREECANRDGLQQNHAHAA